MTELRIAFLHVAFYYACSLCYSKVVSTICLCPRTETYTLVYFLMSPGSGSTIPATSIGFTEATVNLSFTNMTANLIADITLSEADSKFVEYQMRPNWRYQLWCLCENTHVGDNDLESVWGLCLVVLNDIYKMCQDSVDHDTESRSKPRSSHDWCNGMVCIWSGWLQSVPT